jgi:hypothetical protein
LLGSTNVGFYTQLRGSTGNTVMDLRSRMSIGGPDRCCLTLVEFEGSSGFSKLQEMREELGVK